MKVNYICEYCNESYENEDDAKKCEHKHKEEAEKRERLKSEKDARLRCIEKMLSEYVNDYKTPLGFTITEKNGKYEVSCKVVGIGSTYIDYRWW